MPPWADRLVSELKASDARAREDQALRAVPVLHGWIAGETPTTVPHRFVTPLQQM